MAPVTHLPPPGPHLPWQTPCPFCPQARTPGPSSPDAGTRGGGGGSCTTKPRGSSQRKARPALRTLACVKAQHVMRVTVQLETLGLPPACSLPTVSLPASPHCAHTTQTPQDASAWVSAVGIHVRTLPRPDLLPLPVCACRCHAWVPVPPGTLTSQPLSPASLVVSPPFPCQPGLRGPQRRGLGPQDECGPPPFPPGWG